MSKSWRKRAEHLAPSGAEGVAPLPHERRPRSARGIGAAIGVIALLAGAVGVTVAQLAATPSGAVTSLGIVTGAGPGGGPDVHTFTGNGTSSTPNFFAYNGAFTGGVRVAAGDFNADGVDDIVTGPGPGGGPNLKIFDGSTGGEIGSSFAFDGSFTGGIYVAVGDVNGDGTPDLIVGAGAGGTPDVKVFSGKGGALLKEFLAFNSGYTGGVTVAAGDVNGDGNADVITGSATSDSVVNAFSGKDFGLLHNFVAYPGFQGGVSVGAADINGDGKADIVTGAGPGGGPHVKVFNGTNTDSLLASFFAYDAGFHAGVRVAGTDANGDGTDDVITGAGPGGGPHVKVFDGKGLTPSGAGALLASFFAYNSAFTGGVYVSGHTTAISTAPKVTSTSPTSLGQGATSKDVVVNGSGFVNGTNVTFSGTGITVNSTTFTDSTHLKANVTIASSAPTGARDVTVTRPDAQTAKCTGCFTVNGAPTVNSASPNTGAQGSQVANVNVGGSGFANGATVSFSGSGITVNSTTFNSASQVTANITIASDAPVGNRDVIVTNSDGGSGKFVNGFGVTPGPQVTSVNPDSITPPSSGTSAPTSIVITGSGFVTGATVTVSGTGVTVTGANVDSPTQITAQVTVDSTANHGVRTITVTNPSNGGAGSCAGCFSIGPEPTIMSVSPNQSGQGTTHEDVTIKGTNFSSNSVVSFAAGSSSVTNNGVTVNSTTFQDASTLVANISVASNATPGLRDVIVTNPAPSGSVTAPGAFTVSARPVVSGVSPSSLGQGAKRTITINGSSFQDPANVGFSGNPSDITITNGSIKVVDSTHITLEITVAPNATVEAHDVTVVNADGGTSQACQNCFAVNAAPSVSSTNPPSRAAGSAPVTVTINGNGFVSGAVPTLTPPDGVTIDQVGFVDAQHITMRVTIAPTAAPGARTLTVTNPDGGAGSCSCFTIVAAPIVDSASPNSLNPGDSGKTVTLNGSGFEPKPPASSDPTVTFSGTGITFTSETVAADGKSITLNGVAVASNAATGPRNITVVNADGGSSTCTGCFSVGPAPTLSSVTPNVRAIGTSNSTLTLKGTNFDSTTQVSFSNPGITQVGSPTLVNPSEITVVVNVAGTATTGAGNVTVTNPGSPAQSGTCNNCLTIDPQPTFTNSAPDNLKQGQTADVVVTGTGFRQGAAVSFSGTKVTATTTFNSSTQVTAHVTVASDADTGVRDVIVSNSDDGGSVTCSNCFTIKAAT